MKLTSLLILGILSVATFKKSDAQTNLSQGLVLYFPFNGNANDASGNGNNGIVSGATLTADQAGNPNSAYYFDGIDDNIIVPHATILNPIQDSGFSVTAKVKMQGFYDGFCYNNAILCKGNNHSLSSVNYYGLVTTQTLQDDCTFQDTTNHNYRFDYNGNGNSLTTPQLNVIINNTPHIQLDQWDCLVGVFKNDSSYMYVNGVLRYQLYNSSKPGNTDNLSIGFDAWSSAYPFWFKGVIDEIRIYNRALSAEEIAAYCNPGCSNFISSQPHDSTTYVGNNVTYSVSVTSAIATYQWQVNSGSGFVNITNVANYMGINTATLTVIAPTLAMNNYVYRCIVRNESDCADTSINALLNVIENTNSTSDLVSIHSFTIYPNPSSGYFTVSGNADFYLDVTDIVGRKIFASEKKPEHVKSVDISTYPKGVYLVTIKDKERKLIGVKKLVIE